MLTADTERLMIDATRVLTATSRMRGLMSFARTIGVRNMPVKKALIQLPGHEYASPARKEIGSQVVGEHCDGGEMFESDNAVAISAEEVYSTCIRTVRVSIES